MKQKKQLQLNAKAIACLVGAIVIVALWLLAEVIKVLPAASIMPIRIIAFIYLVVLLLVMLNNSKTGGKKK